MKLGLKSISFLFAGLLIGFLLLGCSGAKSFSDKNSVWVGTWSTAPQLVEQHNMPPAPGLTGNTIRQIVRVSIGGEEVRLRFSNVFSTSPVELKSAAIAESTGGSTVNLSTQKQLFFNKENSVTIAPGGEAYSDPLQFNLKPGSLLAVTIHFGQTSSDVTGHPGSRTTSFILQGGNIASADFSGSVKTDHWYVIQGIDVKASENSKAIAVLGNSITDGRGSGTNKQNRWPDILSTRLLENDALKNIGVLNLGIGGNCVVRGGLGPTALKRFDRDILSQSSVRWLIILEGINDIGSIKSKEESERTVDELIAAYKEMISKAHANGILVYGATILPFAKSFYDTPERQAARDKVNSWIRDSGEFDAVIDFDKIMLDPLESAVILPDMHDGDFLHPNEAGYKRMGESVDLELFNSSGR